VVSHLVGAIVGDAGDYHPEFLGRVEINVVGPNTELRNHSAPAKALEHATRERRYLGQHRNGATSTLDHVILSLTMQLDQIEAGFAQHLAFEIKWFPLKIK
jgi:hypothetical protein